jgi:hypothetical protein
MFGLLLYAFMGDNRGEWLVCMTGPLHLVLDMMH